MESNSARMVGQNLVWRGNGSGTRLGVGASPTPSTSGRKRATQAIKRAEWPCSRARRRRCPFEREPLVRSRKQARCNVLVCCPNVELSRWLELAQYQLMVFNISEFQRKLKTFGLNAKLGVGRKRMGLDESEKCPGIRREVSMAGDGQVEQSAPGLSGRSASWQGG